MYHKFKQRLTHLRDATIMDHWNIRTENSGKESSIDSKKH